MHFNNDSYKIISFFPSSYVIWLLFGPRSFIPTELFIDNHFLTVALGVAFSSYSIIRTSKPYKSILTFLEVKCSKAMLVFELSGIDFVLTSFGYSIGLFLSVFSDFVCLPEMLPYLFWQRINFSLAFLVSGIIYFKSLDRALIFLTSVNPNYLPSSFCSWI